MGITGMRVFQLIIFNGDFLCVPNLWFEDLKKKKLDLKGAMGKSMGWFLVYLFQRSFSKKKRYHGMKGLDFTI